jgi:hypothetical protein
MLVPTALMGEYPVNPLAVSLFGVIISFNRLLFIILQSYILRNVIKADMTGEVIAHITGKNPTANECPA